MVGTLRITYPVLATRKLPLEQNPSWDDQSLRPGRPLCDRAQTEPGAGTCHARRQMSTSDALHHCDRIFSMTCSKTMALTILYSPIIIATPSPPKKTLLP